MDLTELRKLVRELEDADKRIEERESELKQAKAERRYLAEEVLPDALLDAGFGEVPLGLEDGRKVKVREVHYVSIPEIQQHDAYTWLEDHGHGGIIKRHVAVQFDREQEDEAADLMNELGDQYAVTQTKKIHPSTLRKWVTDQINADEPVPESITVHSVTIAEVK